jgi:hypothetical protein
LRFSDPDDSGADHGIGIDNFSLTAVPEASPFLFGAMICGVVGLAYGGRSLWRKFS